MLLFEFVIPIILSFFALSWVLSYWHDRRKLTNGIFFEIFIISLGLLFLYLGAIWQNWLFSSLGVLVLSLPILALFFMTIPLVILFISTGIRLIKREGFSFRHTLSWLFAAMIIMLMISIPVLLNHSLPLYVEIPILIILGGSFYFIFMFIAFFLAAATYNLFPERKNKDYIIVLGCGLINDKITPLLKSRIDLAIKFYRKQFKSNGKTAILIMSGGQGADEGISEARAMYHYARSHDIPATHIITENMSKNTYQNLKFSREIMDERSPQGYKALFVTNNFHVFRTALLARRLDMQVNGIGSNVRLYYYCNAIIREYIGVLKLNQEKHLFICVISIIVLIIYYYFPIFIR